MVHSDDVWELQRKKSNFCVSYVNTQHHENIDVKWCILTLFENFDRRLVIDFCFFCGGGGGGGGVAFSIIILTTLTYVTRGLM